MGAIETYCPGADAASEVRGAISVKFLSPVLQWLP